MKHVKTFPYEYALYFSTDHVRAGGIWLYVCTGSPTDAGNWKSYDEAAKEGKFDYLKQKPKANPIFRDTVQGYSTETPHLNVIDGTVYMTYHNVMPRGGKRRGQKTLLATSPDGVNFKRINGAEDSVVLDQGGHNGYFRWAPNPFSGVKHRYVGYSLFGGGNRYCSAMWVSDNAIDWKLEQVFRPTEGHAMPEKDQILVPHYIDPGTFRPLGNGEYVGLAAGGNRASGAAKRKVEIYEMFFAADGKTYTRECRKLIPQGARGSLDEEEATEPTAVVIDDTWHMLYVGVSKGGRHNVVMAANGRLNLDAPKSKVLSKQDRQRHFRR